MHHAKTWVIAAAMCAAMPAQAAAPISGRWITQSKDVNNPDKALRNRTILGMNVLTGFKSDGKEWKGQIYDPKSGKTYRSIVYKGKSGNLVVKGCVGPFCQAQTWTPAS